MKKLLLALILCLTLALCLRSNDTQATWNGALEHDEAVLATAQEPWAVAESCTSADAEVTALAATERTFKLIQAAIVAAGDTTTANGEIEFYPVPKWANGARFRAIGITDDGDYVTEIRAGTLGTTPAYAISTGTEDSDTTIVGVLTWVVGTQTSTVTSYELADAVTIVNADWPSSWGKKSGAGDDVAEAWVDLLGVDFLAISPTTATADCKLLIKFF